MREQITCRDNMYTECCSTTSNIAQLLHVKHHVMLKVSQGLRNINPVLLIKKTKKSLFGVIEVLFDDVHLSSSSC